METELKILEKYSPVNIHPDGFKATLKKTGKTLALMAYTDLDFKIFTCIHDRLAAEMNSCIQITEIPEWITKGKTTLIQK